MSWKHTDPDSMTLPRAILVVAVVIFTVFMTIGLALTNPGFWAVLEGFLLFIGIVVGVLPGIFLFLMLFLHWLPEAILTIRDAFRVWRSRR